MFYSVSSLETWTVLPCSGVVRGRGTSPGAGLGAHFWGKDKWRNFKFRPSQDLKNGPPISMCLYDLKMGPIGPFFAQASRRCGPYGAIFTPLARTFFARQLVQEENMGHLYSLGKLGVLSSVFIGDLHGITGRGRNRGNGERVLTFTAEAAVMGTAV